MNEKIQKKYMEFKQLEEQIRHFSEQMDLLEKQQKELANTQEALEKLPGIEKGTDILLPIAAGIWAKGTLQDTSDLLVSIGADTTVKKSLDQTKDIVKDQQEQLAEFEQLISQRLVELSQQADVINNELMTLQKEEQ